MGQECSTSSCSTCKNNQQIEIDTAEDNHNSGGKSNAVSSTSIVIDVSASKPISLQGHSNQKHKEAGYDKTATEERQNSGGTVRGSYKINGEYAGEKSSKSPLVNPQESIQVINIKPTVTSSSKANQSNEDHVQQEAQRLSTSEDRDESGQLLGSQKQKMDSYKESELIKREAPFPISASATSSSSLPPTRDTRPAFQYKSGAIYEGQWIGNSRDGFGVQTWPDGARYEGQWRDNKAQGKGKFWHVDGDIFEGEWEDDKANGFGTYVHVNGAKYEGQWKDDLQDGRGVEMWVDGSKYEGHYKEGKKHGDGKYTWSDLSQYTGIWVENRISGRGTYTWLDGRRYEGEWLNNNMHGSGVYQWKDGRKYDGEYQYDKKHGYGVYVWADGRRYEGLWAYGKQHGKGKYILPDNSVKIGEWEDGKRLKWIDKAENENAPSDNNNQIA